MKRLILRWVRRLWFLINPKAGQRFFEKTMREGYLSSSILDLSGEDPADRLLRVFGRKTE